MSIPPFKVKAIFEYTSPHEDDLHFASGQIITVTDEEDEDWYNGEYVDASGVKQEGIFPRNFVEKYEPTAPPRPTRISRPKKEADPPEPAPAPAPVPAPEPALEPEEPEPQVQAPPIAREPSPKPEAVSAPVVPKPAEASPPTAPKPASSSKPAPPPVSEKPSGSSFRDRIAAFNKAAPPVAPFKPGGLSSGGSNSFIKKPFVAPPPSKNAYVPIPREPPPQLIYKREEDPEIAARESENLEQAEKAGLAPSSNDADAEEQPKPTSLKERIALLQKQQAEQAARHADAAQKKEKPKRPAKKKTESNNTEGAEEGEGSTLERRDTEETAGKHSMDSLREEPNLPRRTKSSRSAATPGHNRKSSADGNDADMSGAGDTTEEPEEMSTGRDDSDERPKSRAPPPREPDVGEEEGASEEPEDEADEDEEEDDIDPEIRRKEELRARMAKMSGGMGMHGMFGPPIGMPMPGPALPKKKKSTGTSERRSSEQGEDVPSPTTRAPPVPMIPLPGLSMPGMTRVRSPEEIDKKLEDDDDQTPVVKARPASEIADVEEVVPERGAPPPPVPGGRPAPPPVPKESRPVAPPPPQPTNPSAGSESDDELSEHAHNLSLITPTAEAPRPPTRAPEGPGSPTSKRVSYFSADPPIPSSPTVPGGNKEKRASRIPPIPGAATPVAAPQSRAPPPPPPTGPLSRSSTGDQQVLSSPKHVPQEPSDEGEVTEYEGDYDTDIAPTALHKDALKAHAKESSFDDVTSGHSSVGSAPTAPPSIPSVSAPRGAPPPLPSQPPPNARQSSEMPRAAPPPPPPHAKIPTPREQEDDEYDPFRYTTTSAPTFGGPIPQNERREEDLYSSSPPRSPVPPPHDRVAPPPPREAPAASASRAPARQSLDISRSAAPSRRSVDLSRMSMDHGYVANEVDLARGSLWWTQPNGTPPAYFGRKDILYEFEESTSSSRGGRTTVTKELYILFQDYSQTIITAQFDAQDPGDVKLEQRQEPPPSRLRQDQLEQAHDKFGRRIYEAVTAKKETVVGDGTPQGLIQELLKPLADALQPIGTRAYGAVVYANLANASTQQNDEIRPGDIISLRNAKFQGKHGPMHAKYSVEVGKPDHVAVVAEWDGTKKKVRAWEQGRESKKVKLESFKLDDLRSGEVKIWRVMPRSWVGWSGQN